MIKTNHKRLKAVLVLEIRKLGSFFLALKLGEFLLFDDFFLDLANFQDFNNFSPFKFLDLNNFWFFDNFSVFNNFLYFLIILSPLFKSLILLAANILLVSSTYNNIVIFSLDVNNTTILLKP